VVVMMVMMPEVMMVVMVMPETNSDAMVVVMMMTHPDGDLGYLGRFLRKPGIIGFQHRHSVRNGIEKIPITRGRCQFGRLRRRRLGTGHGGQSSGRSQQPGYLLIHRSSKGSEYPFNPDH
jgi:hypothetical protein